MSEIKIKFLKDVTCKIWIFDWSQTPPDFNTNVSFKALDTILVSEKNLITKKTSVVKYWLDSDLTNHDDAFVDITLKNGTFEQI